jgi:hypothetical protein
MVQLGEGVSRGEPASIIRKRSPLGMSLLGGLDGGLD